MKKPRYKKHLINGNYYSVKQLTIKLGISYPRINAKILEGATTFQELKAPIKMKKSVNYHRSMYADRHGHWKLLAKALKC